MSDDEKERDMQGWRQTAAAVRLRRAQGEADGPKRELDALLKRAFDLGGTRLLTLITKLLVEAEVVFPLLESKAIKYRGVGRCGLEKLRQLGLLIEDPTSELTTRAANCLWRVGVKSKEEARAAILDGRIRVPKGKHKLLNYGWKTHREVCRWAGLPEPQKPVRV